MTVSSATSKSGPYNGNGSTKTYAYGFRVLAKDHLAVILTDAGVETELVLDTDYTVTLGPSGGDVVLATAPAVGQTITIIRSPPFVQETDLQNQGAYFAETVEQGFDLLTMQTQTLKEKLDRAVVIPASDNTTALADLTAAIQLLASNVSDINAAIAIANEIVTVAGIAGDVTIVAGVAGDVSVVAGIEADVSAVAAVAGDIPNIPTLTADAITAATDAIAAAAQAAASLDSFDDKYLGPKASDPPTDNDGDPLVEGQIYWNTVGKEMRAWDGSAWVLALAASGYATKGYVDSEIADALATAQLYTDTAEASAIAAAAGYTDAEIATRVPVTRQILGTGLLVGGGDLSTDRTLDVNIASSADAKAGTSNAHAMTPLTTAVSIAAMATSALAGIQMAMEIADLKNGLLFLNSPSGSSAYDPFDTTTYLDLVNSVGVDTSTQGVIKPTVEIPTVSFLLHFDGADNSIEFYDSIAGKKASVVAGNAKVTTLQSVFGGACLALDGNGDYLDFASHPDFAFGTGDFTIEGRFRFTALTTQRTLFTINTSGGLVVQWTVAGNIIVRRASVATHITYAWTPTLNQWYHIAVTRSSGTLYLFIDGVLVGSAVNTSNHPQATLRIGADGTPSDYFSGYIDEFMIYKGVALYTADFTPPSAPFYGSYIAPGDGTTIGDMNNANNAFDGTLATYATTTAQGAAGYVGKSWTTPKKISSVIVRPVASGYDGTSLTATITITIYGKNGAAPATHTDGTVIATVTFQESGAGSAGDKTLTSMDTTTAWDHNWVRIVDNIDICHIAEAQFFGVGTITAMTAVSAIYGAAAVPAKLKGFLTVKPIDAIILNSDVFVDYTRDDGMHWTQAVLTDLYTDPFNGFHFVQTDEVDLSSHNADTQIRYRIRTPTAKRIEVDDKATYWN